MPIINLKTIIEAERKIVFDLSRSVDLHEISTSHTNEKAIAGKTQGLIELGEFVTWRAKHFGFYQNLTSKITSFKSPDHFADEMQNGVFKSFIHQHFFETEKNRTIMTDIFEYKSPFGIFGKIADKLFLKKYMMKLLENRNRIIKDFAETEKWRMIIKY